MPESQDTKRCNKCGDPKPLEDFNRRTKGSTDGRTSQCKDCENSRRALKRAANKVPLQSPEPFNRLQEAGQGGCQRYLGGVGYETGPVFECGKFPATPVIVLGLEIDPGCSAPCRTIQRLCPACAVEVGQLWQLLEEF